MKKRIFRNRRARYASVSVVLTVLVIIAVVLVNSLFGSLATRYSWVTPMNAEANYDVSEVSYQLLDSVFGAMGTTLKNEPVKLIFCDTEKVWNEDVTLNYLYQTAKAFDEKYENLILEFHDVRINPSSVKKYTVHPETGEKISMKDSNVIVACGDYFRVYTLEDFFVFSDAEKTQVWGYNGERKLAAGIIHALNPDPKTACLTSNHGEIFYDYELVYMLDDAGYEIVTDFDLAEDDIPQNCTLIITYNPNSDLDFSEGVEENAKLESFLAKDGNNYLVFLSNGTPKLPNLESYLGEWGVQPAYYTDSSNGKTYRYTVQDTKNSITSDGYTIYGALSEGTAAGQWFGGIGKSIVFKNATALTHATDFVSNGNGSYTKNNRTLYGIYESSETAVLWANGIARSGDSAMLMAVTEQTNASGGASRVGVFASAEFVSREQAQTAVLDNPDVMQRVFDVFGQSYTVESINLKPFSTTDIATITTGQMFRWTICLAVIPAGLVAVAGIVILIRRRRA
jgi:hypothetical protein